MRARSSLQNADGTYAVTNKDQTRLGGYLVRQRRDLGPAASPWSPAGHARPWEDHDLDQVSLVARATRTADGLRRRA
jgi:hypothetical protein